VKISGPVAEHILPPDWVTKTIVERGSWPFPALEGIVEIPTIRADGTVLESSGYD
jgi:hypothetical protein